MSVEPTPDLQLEIAHILGMDVVGYSKLLVNEQVALLQELNQVVRGTACFRAAEESGKFIRLPTGDGMVLLFFQNPEQPVQCALEIGRALQDRPHIQLRMGIHSGPINRITDVNDQSNVAGAGINITQRVMDCGDGGHILLSKHLADDLVQYGQWRPHLQDLGEYEVKHGLRLHLFNLCKEGLGNAAVPQKLRRGKWQQRRAGTSVRPVTTPRWPQVVIFMALLFLAVAVAVVSIFVFRRPGKIPEVRELLARTVVIPEKSIAVLPFANLGDEKQSAQLAEGLQDEILTDLARVADLKVISRTSVMQYKSSVQRNLRDIARDLGVAHVLEGTVQTANGHVRVTAQLIDARTDAHIWGGGPYEKELADIFALESELAKTIVEQLKTKLSPAEKAAIEQQPTADLKAYDLYLRGKDLIEGAVFSAGREELFDAVRLLEQALTRDPSFALVYYQLAHAHDQIYLRDFDHTPARLALADAAVQSLGRLRPESGEAHLALAKHLYWGYRDYDRARQELIAARRALPNDPLPFLLIGYIDRRQGRWEESIENMEHALLLDPLNPQNTFILQQISLTYSHLRRYAEGTGALDRALSLGPKNQTIRVQRALVEFDWKADPKSLHATMEAVLAEDAEAASEFGTEWFELSLRERDLNAAGRAVAVLPRDGIRNQAVSFPRAWCEGLLARLRGDQAAARKAFSTAREEAEKTVHEQPDNGPALGALGMIDAALGNKKEATQEGRRAVELLPVSKDSINGALLVQYLAVIYAWIGQKDLALEQLAIVTKLPGDLTYGQLRLDPLWDPLRGDPRFERMIAEMAPK